MATRDVAYEQTGGFLRTSIDVVDEDIDYSLRVRRGFGKSAIYLDSNMIVATSVRRIRQYGILGTAIHHLFPEYRGRNNKVIDVR